jgi:cytochrome c553
MPGRTRYDRRRPDDPERALRRNVQWYGAAVLIALLMLSADGVAGAQPTERAPDSMAARMLACAPCHGPQGEGTKNDYFPRLAGKPAGYLMNQLVAFRNGRRRYPPMNYLAASLSESDVTAVAAWLAALPIPQDLKPVPNGTLPMPLVCGSQPR